VGRVVLIDGRFREARLLEGVESDFAALADMKRIAIDVPIGYGPRQADALARALVGGSSVFSIPERERFDAPFAEGGGISARRTRSATGSATSPRSLRAIGRFARCTPSSASRR
jgi:predicted RNase H-like nuclease